MVMFNWLSRRDKTAAVSRNEADWGRLEQKLERLEQTMRQMAKETRKQNIVVRQLHINQPVVENVTFRLDALDIEELSGSLNLGNNFDVQFDPRQLFGGGKDGNGHRAGSAASGTPASAGASDRDDPDEEPDDGDPGVAALRRTASGYSFRPSPPPISSAAAPNPDSPSRRKL